MDDVLIIGGGVIGLSLAYELSREGQRVRVADRGVPGMESSWAGAGILPPAVFRPEDHPLEQLTGLSHALHARWAAELREQTGIDTGYNRCGGLYVAPTETAAADLNELVRLHCQRGIVARWLAPEEVREMEPFLASERLQGAAHLPDECQLRNPRHVKALLMACHKQGVEIAAGIPIDSFIVRGGRVEAAVSGGEKLHAGQFCIAGGAWSRALLACLGATALVRPIRGQIALLFGHRQVLRHVVNDDRLYLVPRADGHVLVGSTEEDVGFDKRSTAEAIGQLLHFALRLAPELRLHQVVQTWAGLRPSSADGLPYLGRLPDLDNAFVAAGHYRQGLHLSPGTAVVMSQLMRGEPPQIELTPFRTDRT